MNGQFKLSVSDICDCYHDDVEVIQISPPGYRSIFGPSCVNQCFLCSVPRFWFLLLPLSSPLGITVSKIIKWNTVASHSEWLCAHFPIILMPTLVFHLYRDWNWTLLQIMLSKTRIKMFLRLSFQELLSVSHPFYTKYWAECKKCFLGDSQRICACSSLWNYSLFRRIKSSVEGKSDLLCFSFSSHSFPDSCVWAAPWLVALLSFFVQQLVSFIL